MAFDMNFNAENLNVFIVEQGFISLNNEILPVFGIFKIKADSDANAANFIFTDNNDSNDTTEENLSEKKDDTPAEKPAKKRGRPKAAEKSADTAEKPASKRGRPKKDKPE